MALHLLRRGLSFIEQAKSAACPTLAWGPHMWNKIERDGNVDQPAGKRKQPVGTVNRNDDLKVESEVRETVGKVEAALGQAVGKAQEAVSAVGTAAQH